MADEFKDQSLDPGVHTDRELDETLNTWRVPGPSRELEDRLMRSYRSRRPLPWALLSGSVRVPLWAVLACVLLLLVLLPLAIRGLSSVDPKGAEHPSRLVNLTEVHGGTELGSIATNQLDSREDYVTVADLTQLQPTKNLNLKVFRAEERKK